MSILNQPTNLNSAKRKAARVKFLTRGIFEDSIKVWNEINETIWNDPNPQEVLDALGEDAEEIINLDGKIVSFLNDSLTGSSKQVDLDEIISKENGRPNFNTNNGKVIIDNPGGNPGGNPN